MKNLHSTFDYIFNSAHKDSSYTFVLSGWLETIDSVYQGGFSPTFEAIKTEPEKAELFLKFLFIKQKDFVDEKVLKLCLASILRFYQGFEELISLKSNKKYKDK